MPYIPILMKFCTNFDEILLTSPSKQEESHCLHDHPPYPSLLIATSLWTIFGKYLLEYPVLPYIPILMKFCTNFDEILRISRSKQEEIHCLHDHPPYPALLIVISVWTKLENSCFKHGQLYVVCSLVGKPSDVYVPAPYGKTKSQNYIFNSFVFKIPIIISSLNL